MPNTDFLHRLHGEWLEAVRLDPGAVRLEPVVLHVAQESLGHLTSGGVPVAEE